MKLSRSSAKAPERLEPTAMIDVVFLLLVFFLLSSPFLAGGEELAAPLPRRGGEGPPVQPLAEVILELDWREGRAAASRRVPDTAGTGLRAEPFPVRFDEALGYETPDFAAVEAYLEARRRELGPEVPVTVRFADALPWQMLVAVFDIAARLGLRDLGIAAPELPDP
jgi:biopolymer transport protein ExbD